MGRSGYTEDYDIDNWELIKWRGQIASTIRGKNGQAFLRELISSLDALPEKRLISDALVSDGAVCAIGSVGVYRGMQLETLDPEDYDTISGSFGITHQLVREIEWINDEGGPLGETSEQRWSRVRDWAVSCLKSVQETST